MRVAVTFPFVETRLIVSLRAMRFYDKNFLFLVKISAKIEA